MTTPTREEMDAKLDAIETRLDGRVASIEATIRGFMERMEERFKRSDERIDRLEQAVIETRTSLGTRLDNLRTTMIVTAISVVLATVFGIAAFNATVLSNMLATFDSGRSMSAAQAEAARRNEETAALVKQLQQQRPSAAPAK